MSDNFPDSYQIRAARALLGVTQNELAHAASISLATLNNIERALGHPKPQTLQILAEILTQSGIICEHIGSNQAIYFNQFSRPGSYDAEISQDMLSRYLNPDSLLKPRKIVFFTFKNSDEKNQIGILIDTVRRYILLDYMQFSLTLPLKLEILGNLMLQAFTLYSEQIFYCDRTLENTNPLEGAQVLALLENIEQNRMRHPKLLFRQIPDWEKYLQPALEIQDHPMRRLFTLLDHLG